MLKKSRSLYEQFQSVLKANGGEVIISPDLSDPDFAFNPYLDAVSQADALAVFPDGRTRSETVFQRAIDVIRNSEQKLILGANSLYLYSALQDLSDQSLTNRLYLAVDWHPKLQTTETFFYSAYNYWHGNVNYRTAEAYEATQILAVILDDSLIDTRQEVKDRLSTDSFKSKLIQEDVFRFDENGDIERECEDRVIVTPNDYNSGFEVVDSDTCKN
jgi:branched-chain amino acid transport system substrate-binding protein